MTPDATATDGNTTGSSTATTSSATTSNATTSSATTSSTATTAGPTTGEQTATTTGGTLPALEDSCAVFCARSFDCLKPNPYPDLASCAWLCVSGFDPEQPLCTAANTEANECLAGLACPEFLDALMGVGDACDDALAANVDACPLRCQRTILVGEPNCSMSQTCPGEPPTSFECGGAICACKVDDELTKECPAADTCSLGWEAQAMAANTCCGFDY